ncbi:C-terminal binding protein [Streptomyces sp. CBMA156]|uniref:C-terminal binding protein n=1 Tax=Streptomyces sp. CBMA156 TaxID=1930280 RepID=UPI0016619683|nr:C-terminal binding protein [Streptomyces sp. CBMA156]MBD0673727.1 C-terminal binding protein [Streptomyces sp. CBMA156]
MVRIVITDCDHDTIEPEQLAAAEAGIDLVRADSADEDAVIEAAAGADGLIVQYAPITAAVLDALPGLKVVSRYGVGVDTIDVDAAHARGVLVCNVPDYGSEDVSDHAIALALSLLRGIPRLDRRMRQGSYDVAAVKPLHRFRGRTFGVVGLGRIGRATARKARALGFEVVAHDPVVEEVPASLRGTELLSFEDILGRADVLSLHVPLTPATRHLLNSGTLSRMRPDSVVVNTGRGGVVDTEALADAIERGGILGAALDVVENEPLPPSHRLFGLSNVVLTPHTGWYSEESFTELKRRAAENAIAGSLGRTPRDVVPAAAPRT